MVSSTPHAYIPERGDIIWLQFNPQAGHEQAGRRPALVVSPIGYNQKVGLAIVCPITNQIKGYPFEVILPTDLPVTGGILVDQIKNLNWRVRQAQFVCKVPPETITDALLKLGTLLK
ncbi:endoribonuclease MazF [Effusibacillus dendaii]|uniref:mRNA-degrading endonuclease n=1 Tax=Effusibacillus dendaii TaxID=2743772 RepID=A0A7I8DFP4_9BACL|nr:endoribonuclease MazF [Effusibacillus dendaii]BCJ87769.1 mRNA-degrading endonuclease [Effusibacillus dendaii]